MPLIANSDGIITGTFNVPANTPVGIRPVSALGNGTSKGATTFIGQGFIPYSLVKQSSSQGWLGVDPVAQIIALPEARMLKGVDLIFAGLGSGVDKKPVRVELREVDNGLPSSRVIARGNIPFDSIYVRPAPGQAYALMTQYGQNSYHYQSTSFGAADPGVFQIAKATDSAGPARGLIQFDLPNIIGATIVSATFSFNKYNGVGSDIWPIKVSRGSPTVPWSQTSHAWTHWTSPAAMFVADAADPEFTFPASNNHTHGFDVTHIVQAWADGADNNGFMIRAKDEIFGAGLVGVNEFWASGDKKPTLEIQWVRDPESGPAVDGRWTRCVFDQMAHCEAGKVAVVVMTDDNQTSLGVAKKGQTVLAGNGTAGTLASHPYPAGSLMTSPNGISWTDKPDSSLAFRLLAAKFTGLSKDVNLGNFSGTQLTDFIVQATVFRPATGTSVRFKVTRISNGDTYYVNEGEPFKVTTRTVNESYNVVAEIRGTQKMSPILFPGTLIAVGNLADTADYISTSIEAAENFNVTIVLESYTPGSASVLVYAESHKMISGVDQYNEDGTPITEWLAVSIDNTTPTKDVGGGVIEKTYRRTGLKGVGLNRTTRVKAILTGGPSNRSFLDAISVFTKLP